MQQPATIITDTLLQLVSNVQLTRLTLAWPIVSAALIPSVVAPPLRAAGLPCIASLETMSCGNTQHLGTENNCFIDTSGSKFTLQHVARPSGTPGAAEQYVHYFVNIKVPRSGQLRGSGITSWRKLHIRGTPMWTRSRPEQRSSPTILS